MQFNVFSLYIYIYIYIYIWIHIGDVDVGLDAVSFYVNTF